MEDKINSKFSLWPHSFLGLGLFLMLLPGSLMTWGDAYQFGVKLPHLTWHLGWLEVGLIALGLYSLWREGVGDLKRWLPIFLVISSVGLYHAWTEGLSQPLLVWSVGIIWLWPLSFGISQLNVSRYFCQSLIAVSFIVLGLSIWFPELSRLAWAVGLGTLGLRLSQTASKNSTGLLALLVWLLGAFAYSQQFEVLAVGLFGLALGYWFLERKRWWRKASLLWCLGLLGLLGVFGFGLWQNLSTFSFDLGQLWQTGAGFNQGTAILLDQNMTPQLWQQIQALEQGAALFWLEWGILGWGLFFGLGWLVYRFVPRAKMYWFVMLVTLILTFPGLVNTLAFWGLVFTFLGLVKTQNCQDRLTSESTAPHTPGF